jgi:nucleotidyltransferase substrate binding protein (TIGR01987 family)
MEPREAFQLKFSAYKKALKGFLKSLQIDTSKYDEIITDSIKNGQIQKFEYCVELTWKIVKKFLFLFSALDTNSPKEAIKKFYLAKYVNQFDYETLTEMLDDRNFLSHIYDTDSFSAIYGKLNRYGELMERVFAKIEKEAEQSAKDEQVLNAKM